tara:strand:+ start:1090 stop:1275 length:186 start_codon:yes stop_codon:yes gene_type:complete
MKSFKTIKPMEFVYWRLLKKVRLSSLSALLSDFGVDLVGEVVDKNVIARALVERLFEGGEE